jgi:hypothetical protein
VLAFALLAVPNVAALQGATVTSPKSAFGFDFGDDYQLATYTQLAEYRRRLDRALSAWSCTQSGRRPRAVRA